MSDYLTKFYKVIGDLVVDKAISGCAYFDTSPQLRFRDWFDMRLVPKDTTGFEPQGIKVHVHAATPNS